MAYNEQLAQRIAVYLKAFGSDITSKKMFGGICFLYQGKMCAGVVKDSLMARAVEPKATESLSLPGVRKMDYTGKPLKEFLYIDQEAIPDEESLAKFIEMGIEHAQKAKAKASAKAKKKGS